MTTDRMGQVKTGILVPRVTCVRCGREEDKTPEAAQAIPPVDMLTAMLVAGGTGFRATQSRIPDNWVEVTVRKCSPDTLTKQGSYLHLDGDVSGAYCPRCQAWIERLALDVPAEEEREREPDQHEVSED